jgi:uncharacterized protein YbjT (DUF2867 family)
VRIAVTGGTGFVGSHLVRALVDDGHDVVIVARGSTRKPRRKDITFVPADLNDSPPLRKAFKGCDAVIHLVAVIREKGQQTFERVNRDAAERVAEAAGEAGVTHLLHQSAIGVDPDPRYPYLASKWGGEQAIRGSGVPYTVLRPSVIFGPGDGFFTVLTKLIRLNPVVPIAGDGKALFQPMFINDVVDCYRIALERGPSDKTYEVGGPEHMTYEDIVLTIKNGLGMHRFVAHVPVRALLPPVFLMEHLLSKPPVTLGQLRLLEKNNITMLNAVPKHFGFEPERFADNVEYLEDY